jgi:5-(carboxyamino)imidazole ribonucleotide synthase
MIRPGQRIGILGGGQLGRMFAIAARRMGYRVHALDPTADCPAGQVADVEITAAYDDLAAAEAFARDVDVVTFEFENVPAETLSRIAAIRPVHPSPFVLETTRHRLREKTFLKSHGFPLAEFREVRSAADVERAADELGRPCVLKTAEFGYDGKGQSTIKPGDDAAASWKRLRAPVGVVEAFVPFSRELSVVIARNDSGDVRCYPPFENRHANHILDLTTCGGVDDATARRATDLATAIASTLELVGVLCVELFDVSGTLLVNELAPRPHNSGHLTIDACATDQFEQQVRAVCGLPLGSTELLRPAAMANLLGDLWEAGEPDAAAAMAVDGVKVHLYGKHTARPGRKMGHVTAIGASVDEARERVLRARDAMTKPAR